MKIFNVSGYKIPNTQNKETHADVEVILSFM